MLCPKYLYLLSISNIVFMSDFFNDCIKRSEINLARTMTMKMEFHWGRWHSIYLSKQKIYILSFFVLMFIEFVLYWLNTHISRKINIFEILREIKQTVQRPLSSLLICYKINNWIYFRKSADRLLAQLFFSSMLKVIQNVDYLYNSNSNSI